jgi:hypothetical protein
MSYLKTLIEVRTSMREVIHSRDVLIDRLVKHETNDAYPLTDIEKRNGTKTYCGVPLLDEKQDLLKEISSLTSWIEYQKERVETAELCVEIFDKEEVA